MEPAEGSGGRAPDQSAEWEKRLGCLKAGIGLFPRTGGRPENEDAFSNLLRNESAANQAPQRPILRLYKQLLEPRALKDGGLAPRSEPGGLDLGLKGG